MTKEIKLYVFEIDSEKSQSKVESNLADLVNAGWQIIGTSGAGTGYPQGSSRGKQKTLQHIIILEREVPAESLS